MEDVVRTSLRGAQVLHNPRLNKSSAFTQEERDLLGLNGLLPTQVLTVEQQIKRCYQNFSRKRTPLGKYVFLTSLLNRNEALFYPRFCFCPFPSEMLHAHLYAYSWRSRFCNLAISSPIIAAYISLTLSKRRWKR